MFIEGDIAIDFASARHSEKLDSSGKPIPKGLCLVDCVIEEENYTILVEIKDPSCAPKGAGPAAEAAIAKQRQEFVAKIENDSLISEELVPKARDSYTYLHLMKRDGRRIVYVFLLGADKLNVDHAQLISFKDRLLARIRQESDQPWKRQYVADCIVLTERDWPVVFPQYPLSRLSQMHEKEDELVLPT